MNNNYESVFDNDSVRVKLEKHPVHGAAISLDLMEDGEQTAGTTIYLGQEQIDGMAAWLDNLRTPRPEEGEWNKVERRKDNWTLIVNEYEPKIGFQYKDSRGDTYTFFGLVHADDDYYYGLMGVGGKVLLASCVGGLEHLYDEIPNGGRCSLCNCVYPESGPEKCDRYRCPEGDYPLEPQHGDSK